ncbi:hypothetical protein GCM10009760_10360 [Kitasatospora kazusensis]|uniref:HTH araC/xylS-type domain-containing protein n=1 Tax=Kitasatospora kazusensis TaxID=407974 RepID=A0ABN2YX61_9ACTN
MLRVDSPRVHLAPLPGAEPARAADGRVQIVRGHDEKFQGTTVQRQFGDVRVSLVEGGPFELIRPARLIGPESEGYLRVCRLLTGQLRVFQDGRCGVARGPQLICFDSTRSYKIVMPERFRMVDVLVSHRLMGITPKDAELLTARPWCGALGLAALMSELLAGLEQHAGEVETAIDLLGGSVASLAAALIAERMRGLAADSEVARQALMLHVQAYIRERLADPELCPAAVAQRYNVSLRYLQKIFAEHGTSPARWIRDERLARCRAELGDPGLDHLPVAVIGERSGLYGASHFSRLFRDRYGTTPRDYRKTMAVPAGPPAVRIPVAVPA